MKYIFIVVLFVSSALNAGVKAVTDEGDIVFLHPNGTWEYENRQADKDVEIATNKATFTKSSGLTFQLRSKKTDVAAWINPKSWTFKKATSNNEAEYELQMKGEDLYGVMISEGIEIDPKVLIQIAFDNAKAAAQNMKIIKQEYRSVNGENVIYMEMQGTIQGIELTYFGYYFSNAKGTTQLLAYTATNLTKKYRNEIDTFLNGFSTES